MAVKIIQMDVVVQAVVDVDVRMEVSLCFKNLIR